MFFPAKYLLNKRYNFGMHAKPLNMKAKERGGREITPVVPAPVRRLNSGTTRLNIALT